MGPYTRDLSITFWAPACYHTVFHDLETKAINNNTPALVAKGLFSFISRHIACVYIP